MREVLSVRQGNVSFRQGTAVLRWGPMDRRSSARRWLVALVVIGLTAGFVWLTRGGRGELYRVRAELRARGEKLTEEELALAPGPDQEAAWRVLEEAEPVFASMKRAEVPESQGGFYDDRHGVPPQVAWRQPVLHSCMGRVLDWELAAGVIDETSAELEAFCQMMRSPPSAGREGGGAGSGAFPNYAPLRIAVQGLHDRTMVELHRGRLDAAGTNLMILIRSLRCCRDDRGVVGQMMRVAMAGLVANAVWQALQAEGWDESQLQELQEELQSVNLLDRMAEAMECERVRFLSELDRIRQRGVGYVAELSQRYGLAAVSGWKQRIHYFYWRRFRAARAEIATLRGLQLHIDLYRELRAGGAFNELRLRGEGAVARPHLDQWLDEWVNSGATWSVLGSFSAGPNYSRAAEHAVGNESLCRLAVVAIALERWRLKHGEIPWQLTALVPELLPTVPTDPYDGMPIRFERFSSGRFILYTVGPDGSDTLVEDRDPCWRMAEDVVPQAFAVGLAELLPEEPEVLPLILMEDAPLVDVIETLARHAGLNLIVEPDLYEVPYPAVNLNLENVTSVAVLEAVLRNNALKLRVDPKRRICIITR